MKFFSENRVRIFCLFDGLIYQPFRVIISLNCHTFFTLYMKVLKIRTKEEKNAFSTISLNMEEKTFN